MAKDKLGALHSKAEAVANCQRRGGQAKNNAANAFEIVRGGDCDAAIRKPRNSADAFALADRGGKFESSRRQCDRQIRQYAFASAHSNAADCAMLLAAGVNAIPRRIRPNPPNADGRAEKRFPCAPVRGWPPRALAIVFGNSRPPPPDPASPRARILWPTPAAATLRDSDIPRGELKTARIGKVNDGGGFGRV